MMPFAVSVVDSARDLGVVIDSRLTMSNQVTALCRAGYYQIRQLRLVASPGVHIQPSALL